MPHAEYRDHFGVVDRIVWLPTDGSSTVSSESCRGHDRGPGFARRRGVGSHRIQLQHRTLVDGQAILQVNPCTTTAAPVLYQKPSSGGLLGHA